jgi:hypothetical protein
MTFRFFPRMLMLVAGILCVACSQPSGETRKEIATVRPAPADSANIPVLNTTERMRIAQAPPPGMPGAGAAGAPAESPLAYTLPEGWFEKPATPLRVINLQPGPSSEAECYVTVLGGDGGGLASNVNRWRRQMGLEPYSDDELAALETRDVLGHQATYVDMRGTFTGMGGAETVEDARLVGLVLVHSGRAIFVKMTGPDAVVEEQLEAFNAFVDSLGREPAGTAPEAPPMASAGATGDEFDADRLRWETPDGWEEGPERMMRVVTFALGDVECYVSALSGTAGGVLANINRWQQQMGQEPLTEEDLAQLPTMNVLGQDVPLVSIEGDFTGMGGQTQPDSLMLGTVCPMGSQTVFIKLTGPSQQAAQHREKFIAFCESLSLES